MYDKESIESGNNKKKSNFDLFSDDEDDDDGLATFLLKRPRKRPLSSSPPPSVAKIDTLPPVDPIPIENNNKTGLTNNINNININNINNINNATNTKISHLVDFGTLHKQYVVGITNYNGHITPDQSVNLIREHHSSYDGNDIRVENKANVQIGYLAKNVAAVLAPLIDHDKLWIEGIVDGEKDLYRLPIRIRLFGPVEERDTVVNAMKSLDLRMNTLRTDNSNDSLLPGLRPITPEKQLDAPKLDEKQWAAVLEEEKPLLAAKRNEIVEEWSAQGDWMTTLLPTGLQTFKYHISHGERNVKRIPGYAVDVESYSVVSLRRLSDAGNDSRVISAANPQKLFSVDVKFEDVSRNVASANPDISSAFLGSISFIFDNEERSNFVVMEKLAVCAKKLKNKHMVSVGIPLLLYDRLAACLRERGFLVGEQTSGGYNWIHGDFGTPIESVFTSYIHSLPGVAVPLGDPMALMTALKGTALLCNVCIKLELTCSFLQDVTMEQAKKGKMTMKCTVDKCFVLDVSHAVPFVV